MRRFALLACLALAAAGCGSTADPGSGPAPTPADLAGSATEALYDAGSAHFVVDGSVEAEGEDAGIPTPISFHFEGDYSSEAFAADGNVSLPGANFSGGLLVGQHELFLNLMGRWFGTRDFGLADAEEQMQKDDPRGAELYRDLQTGEGVRRYFDRVLTGEVREGPDAGGTATWEFEGHPNVDGIAGLAAELGGEPPSEEELAPFRAVAEAIRVTFLVGRDDNLPRRLEVNVELTPEHFAALEEVDGGFDQHGFVRANLAVELSDFGKDVEYEAPAQFEPLEKAAEAFFGGLG